MKNLLGRLMGRSFDDLKLIAASWQVPLAELNHNDAAIAIYREMAEKPAMRAVWGLFDAETRDFVRWLLRQRNSLALVEDLPARLARPAEEIEPLLARIVSLGLADVDEQMVRGSRVVSAGDNLYNWGVRNLTPPAKKLVVSISNEICRTLGAVLEEMEAGDPFAQPLTVLLDRLEQPILEKIAQLWHLPDLRYQSKPSLIEMLDSLLESRQVREQMLLDLPAEARQLFELICASGGRIDAAAAASQMQRPDRDLRHWFGFLEAHALAFETLWQHHRVLFVPRQVLDPDSTAQHPIPTVDPVPPPQTVESRLPTELAWDLLSMLAYFKQTEVGHNLHNGGLPRRALKRINETFIHARDVDTEPAYQRLLLHCADIQQLLQEEEKTRRLLPGPLLDEWVRRSLAAQSLRLFSRWLDDRRLRDDTAQPFYIWRTPDPTAARKRLVKELAECLPESWLSIDDLLAHIRAADPYLLYTKDEMLRQGGMNALRDFHTNWPKHEGNLLRGLLTGVLFWFGVVEIGRNGAGPELFRVTRAGVKMLAGNTAPVEDQEHEQKPFLVTPNFEVLVLAAETPALWTLLLCADLGRHDRVSVYTLSKESVLRARESGYTVAQLRDFLTANSQKQVPQNVLQSISDWARGYKRATVRKATLLEVEEAELLDELLASRRLRDYEVRRLGPLAAMITPPRNGARGRDDGLARLARELRAAGFFPDIAEEARPAAKPEGPRRPDRAPESPAPAPNGTLRRIVPEQQRSG